MFDIEYHRKDEKFVLEDSVHQEMHDCVVTIGKNGGVYSRQLDRTIEPFLRLKDYGSDST